MEGKEGVFSEDLKKKKILAVCAAGVNRSGFIAEELRSRGYNADNRGVLKTERMITAGDLTGVGILLFASANERNIFEEDAELAAAASKEGITIANLNVTQSDLDHANYEHKVSELKIRIASELNQLGFKKLDEVSPPAV